MGRHCCHFIFEWFALFRQKEKRNREGRKGGRKEGREGRTERGGAGRKEGRLKHYPAYSIPAFE